MSTFSQLTPKFSEGLAKAFDSTLAIRSLPYCIMNLRQMSRAVVRFDLLIPVPVHSAFPKNQTAAFHYKSCSLSLSHGQPGSLPYSTVSFLIFSSSSPERSFSDALHFQFVPNVEGWFILAVLSSPR